MPNILHENLVVQRHIPIYGITTLGLRSHPTGSSTFEALTTLSFIRSDKPVFKTRRSDPVVLATLLRQWHIRNPYLTFPGIVHHFHRCLDPGLGRPHGGFSDCDIVWTRSERELHINVLDLRAVIWALNHWAIV